MLVSAMSERPFARVYYVDLQRDYPSVWDDDEALATWLRLLAHADALWPISPYIPHGTNPTGLTRLRRKGLVSLRNGRYNVKGYEVERGARSDHAKVAASTRWAQPEQSSEQSSEQSTSNATRDGTGTGNGSNATLPLSEGVSLLPAREDDRPDIEAFILAKHRIPTPAQRKLMDDYLKVFDQTGPQRSAQLILRHPDNPIGALKDDLAAFRKERLDGAATPEKKPVRVDRRGEVDRDAALARLYGDPA